MATLNLFTDAGLTTAAVTPLSFQQDTAGLLAPHVRHFYLGSNDPAIKFEALSDPGVDQVELQIIDTASGSGQPASAIKLALTEGGLATAVGGATLDLGTQVQSGAANAISIWVEFNDSTAVVATDTSIKLQTNALQASAA